jgi:pullulanase
MQLIKAFFDDYDLIRVKLDKRHFQGKAQEFYIIDETNNFINTQISEIQEFNTYFLYTLKFESNIAIGKKYTLADNYFGRALIEYRFIVKTKRFNREFNYNKELGSIVEKNKTTFRLWAPTANEVILKLFDKNETRIMKLNRQESGIFELSVNENLDGYLYRYLVDVNGSINEVVDPYGKAKTPNTIHSIVVDFSKLEHEKIELKSKVNKLADMFIYELSVYDYSDEKFGFKYPHKFKSFSETGLKDKSGNPIGIDYLKQLGVSHVQLQPILDFATKDEIYPDRFYNWGYDPLTYFSFEGSYVTNPFNHKLQIMEVREMVNSFHKAGIRVVLDVVYNHVYDLEIVVFDKIIPYYFYRYNPDFSYSQGSMFVDIDTKQVMVQKFLTDNVKYLVKEFDIDGFRFDLMGIIDCDTMDRMYHESKQIKDDVIFYGEGWNNSTNLEHKEKCTMENDSKHAYISFFNDYFRDNVAGQSWSHSMLKGYALGDVTKSYYVADVLKGKHDNHFYTPWQSINFIECHDGLTLADKIRKENGKLDKNNGLMAMAMLILGQGILFIHQGQEILKSKNMLDNTYNNNSGVNIINWDMFEQEKTYLNQVKELIKFRKDNSDLFFNSIEDVEKNVNIYSYFNAIIYEVNGKKNNYRYIFNNSGRDLDISKFSFDKIVFTNSDAKMIESEDLILNNSFAIFKL